MLIPEQILETNITGATNPNVKNVGPLTNIPTNGTVVLASVYVVCSNGSGKCNDAFNIYFGDNPPNITS